MKIVAGALLILALSLPSQTQSELTGRWQGKTPNGSSIVVDFMAEGGDLSGTMNVGAEKSAIENGKVSKNTFTFSVMMGGGSQTFTGEISGDEIRMWMDERGPGAAVTLKRAADK